MVGGSSQIPKIQEIVKSFFGENTKIKIDKTSDEIGSSGAAIYGAIEGRSIQPPFPSLFTSRTPLSLGIRMPNGSFKQLIPIGSILPFEGKFN